jgi:hypothetical protein
MRRDLVIQRGATLELRQGGGFRVAAMVYLGAGPGLLAAMFFVVNEPDLRALGVALALFALLCVGAALWLAAGCELVTVENGQVTLARRLFGRVFGARVVPVDEIAEVAVVDHETRPDAMFGVSAMVGPGFVELVLRDGARLPVARGLHYPSESVAALRDRIATRLDDEKKTGSGCPLPAG